MFFVNRSRLRSQASFGKNPWANRATTEPATCSKQAPGVLSFRMLNCETWKCGAALVLLPHTELRSLSRHCTTLLQTFNLVLPRMTAGPSHDWAINSLVLRQPLQNVLIMHLYCLYWLLGFPEDFQKSPSLPWDTSSKSSSELFRDWPKDAFCLLKDEISSGLLAERRRLQAPAAGNHSHRHYKKNLW